MPANGMTYVPPDQCFCSAGVKLLGLNVLTAAKDFPPVESVRDRLLKGPCYGKPAADYEKAQWAAYRHDHLRSGSAQVDVSADLKNSWDLQLDPSITQPVVAGDRLFIASRDTHTVHALASDSGKKIWSFTAGGRVDSSPHSGRACCCLARLMVMFTACVKVTAGLSGSSAPRRISV